MAERPSLSIGLSKHFRLISPAARVEPAFSRNDTAKVAPVAHLTIIRATVESVHSAATTAANKRKKKIQLAIIIFFMSRRALSRRKVGKSIMATAMRIFSPAVLPRTAKKPAVWRSLAQLNRVPLKLGAVFKYPNGAAG